VIAGVVCANGDDALITVLPNTVIGNLLADTSMNKLLWQVNKLVPDIAVSGCVGGVNAEV
jgi:hypothetical protein